MKRAVVKKAEGLEIQVTGIQGGEERLLEAFQECAEGRCSCPTEEYAKLEALDVEHEPGAITLTLKARKGQRFDPEQIDRCLDYTVQRLDG